MAQKKTYIYRVLIGNADNNGVDVYVDTYMYARNSKDAVAFCKNQYRDKKYNSYQTIKVGVSHNLRETQIVSEYEAEKLKNSIASQSDKYSEREMEAPKFITIEEAGELNL